MRQLLNLQEVMLKTSCSEETEARDRASCARTWCELEKLRMVKLGKPIVIGSPSVNVKLPRMRKFGRLASIIDVDPTPKAPENATSQAETGSVPAVAEASKSEVTQ